MSDPDAVDAVAVEGPVQIITVNETGDGFTLHEERVRHVTDQIPHDLPIAVCSVVGAFRTGKSFLLDLILRYLRYYDENADAVPSYEDESWMEGTSVLEGAGHISADALPTHSLVPDSSVTTQEVIEHTKRSKLRTASRIKLDAGAPAEVRAGFKWRPGKERTTTGIWLWSRPFIRKLKNGDKVGVVLMDTQGLFDHDTAQQITTCIFALSTLISSHVVYNLQNRIQEDNLQNLALFAEYGRRVQTAQQEFEAAKAFKQRSNSSDGTPSRVYRPFQRIEFLVRDAEIDDEFMVDATTARAHSRKYLDDILHKVHNKDLKMVRDMIGESFETLECFELPHPSLDVVKKTYDGNTRVLRPEFKRLLNYYLHQLFNEELAPKRVAGNVITAPQLYNCVVAYSKLFQEKAVFPEAMMLIDATADANNRNAYDAALRHYRAHMEEFFAAGYQNDEVVAAKSAELRAAGLDIFDQLANFGPDAAIESYRKKLTEEIALRHTEFLQRNKDRNPLKNIEVIVFAIAVILSAWVIRFLLEYTCAPFSDFCRRGSQMFAFIGSFTLLGLIGVILLVGKGAIARLQAMANAVLMLAKNGGAVAGLTAVLSGGSTAASAPTTSATAGEQSIPSAGERSTSVAASDAAGLRQRR